jgi:tRNA pseudouridine38-40 synthase
MKLALKIAYDGSSFHGYARQPNVTTVEGCLLNSLIDKKIITSVKKAQLRCASRTDKYVSALTNVITFNSEVDPGNILTNLEDAFDSIYAYGIAEVDEDFNPRFALKRTYHYFLPFNQFSSIDLKKALALFVGTHDFSNFARIESHRNPIRTIDQIKIVDSDNVTTVQITAQTFLWNQIRRLISAAIKYCQQKISLDQIKNALDHPETAVDFNLVNPRPLILYDIQYPNLSFYVHKEIKERKNKIEEKIRDQITNLVF